MPHLTHLDTLTFLEFVLLFLTDIFIFKFLLLCISMNGEILYTSYRYLENNDIVTSRKTNCVYLHMKAKSFCRLNFTTLYGH